MTRRRALLASSLGLPAWPLAAFATDRAAAPPATERVLRYALPAAETGFDPQQISDLYSRTVTGHIFEALYDYDHLARPQQLVPMLAEAMPEIDALHQTFTVRLRRGVLFHDDPAFQGRPRELTAEDVVYTFKRLYDPATKSSSQPAFEELGVIGLRELRQAALDERRPFDYAAPVEGLQALDRYTVQFRLRESRPRFVTALASPDIWGVMAREVVERYGDRIMEHPVGTGPFMLAEWRRSSRIVLVRHPRYRERHYDARPAPGDAEGQALLARFKGRRLPMIDRVELSIIEEAQPRWLAFLNGEQDLLQIVPPDFIGQAIPGGELAPHLARRGVRKYRVPNSDVNYIVFNMEHPTVGGLEPAQVALRRAISLGHDVDREIRIARRGEAMPAQQLTTPGTSGHDPAFRTDANAHSPARARALLDLYGFRDRDGDGWRERPDGSPLTLELLAQSDQSSRQLDEVFKKSMDALGLRVELKVGQWAENLKATRAGRFMVWRVGSSAASPDGQGAMERAYSGSIGKGNLARLRLPAFDEVYLRLQGLPDGPEREALFRQANKLALAYMPYRVTVHRIVCDLAHAPLQGYRRPPFWLSWWSFVDIEPRPTRRD
ncbi:ABC-type transport system substrate-binding protein [Sphaerotilus hippei]|uniref:ABC-type transport system substrate-binding protein n=1 Tax=Sphaerotilus hippei TaxID=744406 RepID=A0A318GW94_9BURK|nr:ABC transporter substrate-binding protein [Sphaerotilus hippei]PXW93891.1 ABC-type transport system substrate-binding protein [Sphaerotilus hippei]